MDGPGPRGNFLEFVAAIWLIIGIPISIIATPILLWKGFRQLTSQPNKYLGRKLGLRTMMAYVVLAVLFFSFVLITLTRGFILFPIAIVAITYYTYTAIRKLYAKYSVQLPVEIRSTDSSPNGNKSASSPAPSMMSIPTV